VDLPSFSGPAPLVIAHRGASADAPENTLAAFALAVEQQARLAECDVYLSRDGVPMVFHDSDLDRTTNGTGPLVNHSLIELKKLDAGSWKAARYRGERIPTLVEFLIAMKGKLRPVIEIKGEDRGIESAVIAALRDADIPSEDVMIFSFHRKVIAEIARQDPALPTTWLVTPPKPGEDPGLFFHSALSARVSAIGVGHENLTPALLRRAHESGLAVYVWTVNDRARVVELAHLGVDAIITDRPAIALDALGLR
jgi:glycerophosphoryl diester phosphodiesterase